MEARDNEEQNIPIENGQTEPETEANEGAEDTVTLPRQEFEQLAARLQEAEDLKEKLMRSAADFENAKKRLARDRDEFVKFSQESFIKSLLPVLDNFERALSHAKAEGQDPAQTLKGLITGIEMVQKQLQDALKNQGLQRVEALNKPFDPHQHEALGYIQEEGEEDQVIAEIEPGYTLHGRLLRAAKVNVRVAPAGKSPENQA